MKLTRDEESMRIWDLPPAILCRQHLLVDHELATGDSEQTAFVDGPTTQVALLRAKGCACRLLDAALGREEA